MKSDDLRSDPRQRLEESMVLIARLVRSLRFRYGLSADETEEFHSTLLLKLVDHDYAVLRRFRGRSRFSTYLTVVAQRALLDFRNAHWGRWRPSAAARQLGPLAIRLETLIVRDGMATAEAIATVGSDPRVDAPAETLETLAARLPQRIRRRFEDSRTLDEVAGPTTADVGLNRRHRRARAAVIEHAARRALAALPVEERQWLRWRFVDGMSICCIAERIGVARRPLYRRFARNLRVVRRRLEASGVDRSYCAGVIGRPEVMLRIFDTAPLTGSRRPEP